MTPTAKKNNGLTLWLVAALFSALSGIILFMGNVVKANDLENTKEHTAIRKEQQQKIDKLNEDIQKILIQTTEIATIVKTMKKD